MPSYVTRRSRIKRILSEGKVVLETIVQLTDPVGVELVGLGGFDAATLAWEYTSVDWNTLENLIRAAEAVDIDLNVRLPEIDLHIIKRVLDLGARGLWLPHDGQGVEGVKKAIDAMHYPPEGRGGDQGRYRTKMVRVRATGHNAIPWDEHLRRQKEIVLIVPLEDEKAIAEAEQIAALPEVDLLTVGVYDVADAIGVPYSDLDAIKAKWIELGETVKRHGKKLIVPYGVHPSGIKVTPQEFSQLNVGMAHVFPTPTGILLEHYQARSQELRSALGYPEPR